MDSPTDRLSDYVERNYSMAAVEVSGTGPSSVTLKLPYQLPDFCSFIHDITTEFNATVDLVLMGDGAQLVVYPSRQGIVRSPKLTRRNSWILRATLTLVGTLALVIAAHCILARFPGK